MRRRKNEEEEEQQQPQQQTNALKGKTSPIPWPHTETPERRLGGIPVSI